MTFPISLKAMHLISELSDTIFNHYLQIHIEMLRNKAFNIQPYCFSNQYVNVPCDSHFEQYATSSHASLDGHLNQHASSILLKFFKCMVVPNMQHFLMRDRSDHNANSLLTVHSSSSRTTCNNFSYVVVPINTRIVVSQCIVVPNSITSSHAWSSRSTRENSFNA